MRVASTVESDGRLMSRSNARKTLSSLSRTGSFSTSSTDLRLAFAAVPQQYTVFELRLPPYSSQMFCDDEQVASKSVKFSNPCDTNPVTSTLLWLKDAGSIFS